MEINVTKTFNIIDASKVLRTATGEALEEVATSGINVHSFAVHAKTITNAQP